MTKRKGTDDDLRGKLSDEALAKMRAGLPQVSAEQFDELTRHLRLAPGEPEPWAGYTTEEREAIRIALPGATAEMIIDLVERVESMVRGSEADINTLSGAASGAVATRDRELKSLVEPIRALKWRVADMRDIVGDGDQPEPIHRAAATALKALENYRTLLCEERDEIAETAQEFASRLRPNRENIFQKMLFEHVARAWKRSGYKVNFGQDYRMFFESIVMPIYVSPWVQQVKGVAPSATMFKAHVQSVQKWGSPERAQN